MYEYFCHRDYSTDFPLTDLACERRRADVDLPGVEYKRETAAVGEWERIKITDSEGARSIGRPIGIYDTLNLPRFDLIDRESAEDAGEEMRREMCHVFDECNIIPERILVAGLGNRLLTPDSFGSAAAGLVRPTMHIKELDPAFFEGLGCSEICVITPGVASASGVDACTVIRGVCHEINPTAVIAIDALAARSSERLGTTVQISSTGIYPGSGLGNSRTALSLESLGVPVIGIGVPTVIDSRMLWYDRSRWQPGEKSDEAHSPMFVSPKEINEIVNVAAEIVSYGINAAFGLIL